ISTIVEQFKHQNYKELRIVIGMVNDKDIRGVLHLLPKEAIYYFTQASVRRAMSASELAEIAHAEGLKGDTYPNVEQATMKAIGDSDKDDFVFVGGSSFIVADLLTFWQNQ